VEDSLFSRFSGIGTLEELAIGVAMAGVALFVSRSSCCGLFDELESTFGPLSKLAFGAEEGPGASAGLLLPTGFARRWVPGVDRVGDPLSCSGLDGTGYIGV